jgi:hypothetical protein
VTNKESKNLKGKCKQEYKNTWQMNFMFKIDPKKKKRIDILIQAKKIKFKQYIRWW